MSDDRGVIRGAEASDVWLYDNGTGYGAGWRTGARVWLVLSIVCLTFRHKVEQILAQAVSDTYTCIVIETQHEQTMNAQAETVRAAMDAGNYQEGARAALESMGARLTCTLSDTKRPDWADTIDDQYNPHWRCRIARGHRSHTFDFYDSVNAGENGAPKPSAYSVLACLQWTDPGTFEDFCGEFDMDTDSRGAERTWKACAAQYKALCRVFTEEQREALSEIR